MKPLKTIILALWVSLSGYAQDPQLFEGTWYLQKLVLDGEDHFPPSNNELDFVWLNLDIDRFDTGVCAQIGGTIIEINNDFFTVEDFFIIPIECSLQVNADFEDLYFGNFLNVAAPPPYTYNYLITLGSNGSKTLTLTNDEGDLAIYGNEQLSTPDFNSLAFEVYPNPVEKELFINLKHEAGNIKVQLLDLYGKLIVAMDNFNVNKNSINVQALTSGFYFILLENTQGNTAMKKIIKQ